MSSRLDYLIFFSIFLVIASIIYGYSTWRLLSSSNLGPISRKIIWVVIILFVIFAFLPFPLRQLEANSVWVELVSWIGYIGLGFFFLLFNFILLRDLLFLLGSFIYKLANLIGNFFGSGVGKDDIIDPTRRQFLTNVLNMGILSVTGYLTGFGLVQSLQKPKIVEVSVSIDNLPADLEEFRIVQLTDVHVGPTIKKGFVEKITDQANRLDPDIVVFTGDLADGSVSQLKGDVSPLKNLTAKQGKFFVTGNHEYYSGVADWLKEVQRLGFTPLMDEHKIVTKGKGKILLGGVTDFTANRFVKSHVSSPKKAIQGAGSPHVKILLAHQPRNVFAANAAGFDLQISGHTHGGQFFPWNYLVKLEQPYISGLHRYKNIWIYVSRGAGYWGPPLRLGAPSEITLIKLKRKI